jgi:hypothetical protein
MENEAATIPQYNKETPATICKRCGFVVKDPNTDFEISPDDNSRMHRLAECFRLVKLAYDSITVVPPENTVEQQSAAFNQGFRGSKPLSTAEMEADKDDEAGLNDPKRKKK